MNTGDTENSFVYYWSGRICPRQIYIDFAVRAYLRTTKRTDI